MDLNKKELRSGENTLLLSAALITAVVAVSFAAIFIRLSQSPALTIAFYRLLFSLVVLLPQLLLQRDNIRALEPADYKGMGLSGIFLAAHFFLWISSLEHSPVAVAVILVSMHPLLVAVAGSFFIGDAIPRRFFISMFLVLVGTAAIASEGASGFAGETTEIRGILMALGGAAMMAGYILAGRHLRQKLTNTVYVSGTYSVAALVLLAASVLAGVPLGGYPAREYLIFIALALVPTLLGHTVFNWALEKVRASLVSLLYLGEPLGATLLAFIILREAPTALQAIGGAVILSGLFLVIRSDSAGG